MWAVKFKKLAKPRGVIIMRSLLPLLLTETQSETNPQFSCAFGVNPKIDV